ncbi:MAG: hypothetical protein EHM39_13160 [Chloroflexi bacterium]|nr:MAG: hypothetical protein EHM39_13160 [Chloroflexota bacterium]
MDILDLLLGGSNRRRRRDDGISGLVGNLSRWILGCGCILVAVVVVGLIALLAGIISFGEDAVTVIIVVLTIIVAVASLIRTSLGY